MDAWMSIWDRRRECVSVRERGVCVSERAGSVCQ